MAGFNEYPYRDFSGYNLDWILRRIREMFENFDAFAESNTLKYHDPIQWNINTQYEANTVVRYGNVVYLSKKPVPAGVSITNEEYWFQLGDTNAYGAEINRRIKMTDQAPEIALLGDSALKDMYGDNVKYITNFFNGATVTNYYDAQYNKWTTLMGQVNAITETPDIILIWCGSNDALPNNLGGDHGGQFGAPDVWKTTYESGATTTFDAMREVIGTLRNRYPRALIFNILRNEHAGRVPSVWHYLTWYQSLIMYKWGVPIIDANEIVNLTGFNTTQTNIYTEDGFHFRPAALDRIGRRLANIITSGNPAAAGFIPPSVFFAPDSVVNEDYGFSDRRNKLAVAEWVTEHCVSISAGQNGGSISGLVIARGGNVAVNFAGWMYRPGQDTYRSNVHIFDREQEYSISATEDGIPEASNYVKTGVITADNSLPWYSLPDGDYYVRGSGLSTLNVHSGVASGNYLMLIRSNPSVNLDNSGAFMKSLVMYSMTGQNVYKATRTTSTGSITWWSHAMNLMS